MADLREMTVGITFEDYASKAIDAINSKMDAFGLGFADLGSGILGTEKSLKNFGKTGTGSIDKLDGAITGLRDEFSSANFDINDFGKTTVQSMDRADDSVDDLKDSLKDVGRGLNDLDNDEIDDITSSTKKADKALDDAADEADKLGDELAVAGRRGEQAASGLNSAFMKVAGVLGAVFAVDQLKDFAITLVEETGEAEAELAQFAMVFEELQKAASESIEGMADDFGMLPTRLAATYTKTTSMFKGFGMATEDAMDAAGKSVELAADAAAFYDVALDDADGALTSFLKGNTNAAESIGIFATAAGMASFASEKLGLDWKKLDEGAKQLVRLKYVEEMQKAAGATGQAARESDGYENVLGNLQQAWTDLKKGLGVAIFDTAIDGMQTLTDYIVNFDVEPVVEGISDAVEVGVGFATAIRDNWEPIKETVLTLGGALAALYLQLKLLAFINTVTNLWKLYQGSAFAATWAQHGLNAAMRANPIGLVVTAITLLVGIGIALYQNWDTVTAKTKELWGAIGGLEGMFRIIYGPIGVLIGAAVDLANNWDNTKTVWENVWGAIKRSAADSINSVIGLINEMIGVINKIPGVNVPVVAKVDWGQAESPQGSAGISNAKPDGSHSTGLASVPFDNYLANLHRDEAVLTAEQSNTMRSMGMLQSSGGRPVLNLPKQEVSSTNSGPIQSDGNVITKTENHNTFEFYISGENAGDIAAEVRREVEAIFARLNAVTE